MNYLRFAALMAAMVMTMTVQAKTQDWGGRVIDEKGEPMPFVNVVLLSLPDSAFVQGAMTDEQGMFKIVTNVTNGVFKVSSVGYQTLYINAGEDLTIQMKEDTQMLGEVVVKSQLPKTHAKGDAMRTTVAGTILEKAGTVSDALSKIPSLEAEREGRVGQRQQHHIHKGHRLALLVNHPSAPVLCLGLDCHRHHHCSHQRCES